MMQWEWNATGDQANNRTKREPIFKLRFQGGMRTMVS